VDEISEFNTCKIETSKHRIIFNYIWGRGNPEKLITLSFYSYDSVDDKYICEFEVRTNFDINVNIFYLKRYFYEVLNNIKTWVDFPSIEREIVSNCKMINEDITPCNTVQFMEEE
jgi:hypothetical protein